MALDHQPTLPPAHPGGFRCLPVSLTSDQLTSFRATNWSGVVAELQGIEGALVDEAADSSASVAADGGTLLWDSLEDAIH